MYACMYACIYIHVYIHTYVHMYVCMYVRMYVGRHLPPYSGTYIQYDKGFVQGEMKICDTRRNDIM